MEIDKNSKSIKINRKNQSLKKWVKLIIKIKSSNKIWEKVYIRKKINI